MKDKIYYIVINVGFVAGILFYMFNLIISNTEISFIDSNIEELFRNPDYFTLSLHGFIGADILLLLTVLIINIKI